MINLLPNDIKQSRTYGRRNRILMRWVFLCLGGIVALVVIAGGGYFFINNAEQSASVIKVQTETSLNNPELVAAEKGYTEFSSNLKIVTQILGKQILFSDLIQQIGSVTPTGATLNSVSLSDNDNALNLDFKVNAAATAATIQVNLEDPKNELFQNADIVQVSCQTDPTTNQDTCNVQLRALFLDNSRFIFLNSLEQGKKQ